MPRDFVTHPDVVDAPEMPAKIAPDLDGLITWLQLHPADRTYVWQDCGGACLIGLFYIDLYGTHNPPGRTFGAVFDGFPAFTYGQVCMFRPHTFGAALARARAFRDAQS